MERFFEKISYEEFKKSISDDKELYKEYLLPKRTTKNSAGYDFFAIEEFTLKPQEIKKIPTGYKAKFLENETLFLIMRSGLGFKYNLRLCNQVGVIDSDYYNNKENEGHIYVAIQNEGKDSITIEKGKAYCQGIFLNYLTCGDTNDNIRENGLGSTDKESE